MRIINHLAALFAKSQKQEGRYRLKKKGLYYSKKIYLACVVCVLRENFRFHNTTTVYLHGQFTFKGKTPHFTQYTYLGMQCTML